MDRKPILLNKNACALILIYTRSDEIFDSLAGAYEGIDPWKIAQAAAREFVAQLKGEWTLAFMEALKSEINAIIETERSNV